MSNDKDEARLLPNAILSVLQALVTGAVLFFLYRYLLQTVGAEAVGLWSLILAATSVARISELGLSGSALRYVSKHLAIGDSRRAIEALQTAVLSIALLLSGMVLMVLPLADWLLSLVLGPERLEEGQRLLPYGLVSLWLMGVAASVQAGLDGCHRADLRAIATIISSFAFLGLAYALVPRYGIFGLAYAQIGQGILILLVSWVLVRRALPGLPFLPMHWSKSAFLEMWRYGLNFQLIGIFVILTEPVTKALLTHFGSLAALGYYEMASRMIIKFREVIVNANRVAVPYFSKLNEIRKEGAGPLYSKSLDVVIMISFPMLLGLAACTTGISKLWIGEAHPFFIWSTWVLVAGWLCNILSAPAYFAVLGSDDISPNMIAHLIMVTGNVIFCVILGTYFNGLGVVVGWALALAASSLTIIIWFHRRSDITPFLSALMKNKYILASSTAGVVLTLISNNYLSVAISSNMWLVAQLSLFTLVVLPSLLVRWSRGGVNQSV
jgi:O-antigen/teichoic acid export membrane protein